LLTQATSCIRNRHIRMWF